MSSDGTKTVKEYGASFIAQGGGFCVDDDNPSRVFLETTYGEFQMMPHPDYLDRVDKQSGSYGLHDDIETAGGGRIVIYADSVTFSGDGEVLSANARPFADFERGSYPLAGGSGGYIFVSTSNKDKNNTVSEDVTISAQGGQGIGEYGGGSGGVIVFDDQFHLTTSRVKVNGGQADMEIDQEDAGCMNGGSGTIYYKFNDTLVMDNAEMNSTAFTIVKVPEGKTAINGDQQELAKKLYVQQGARVLVFGEHKDMTFDTLYVTGNSWLELS